MPQTPKIVFPFKNILHDYEGLKDNDKMVEFFKSSKEKADREFLKYFLKNIPMNSPHFMAAQAALKQMSQSE